MSAAIVAAAGISAALWGADLDDADRSAIKADVARRAQPAQAQPEGELR